MGDGRRESQQRQTDRDAETRWKDRGGRGVCVRVCVGYRIETTAFASASRSGWTLRMTSCSREGGASPWMCLCVGGCVWLSHTHVTATS